MSLVPRRGFFHAPVDAVMVSRELSRRGQLKRVGGHDYLSELIEQTPAAAVGLAHAATVRHLANRRRIMASAEAVLHAAGNGTTDEDLAVVVFKPEGVAFLDRVRAIAMQTTDAPRPGYITAVREGLGFTQAELGERLGVDKMTVSRWERGTMKPSVEAVTKLNQLINKAKRSGVVFAA
jgi:DNA-binding transcriptional regulator YiaG